ncbi:sensor histidine kinase [Singulisphaera sp. PoT]|uniref:sensor histidine kinase n=1 Tax=Singulisphaera sp. PoT TaxID=3411797 RepID=UPI003BF5BBE2
MSLATRVSSFFLLALGLALAGFSTALYSLAHVYMLRHLDEHIMLDLDSLAAAAEIGPTRVEHWDSHRISGGLDPEVEDIFWIIYDEQGREVDRSKNSGDADYSRSRNLAQAVRHSHASMTDPRGKRWRLALRQLECAPAANMASNGGDREEPEFDEEESGAREIHAPGKAPSTWGRRSLTLVAGSSLDPLEATLRTLAATLAVLSVALLGLATMVGRFFCRRALVPMTRMAETARDMTTADRGQHLPSPETGDELEDLATSFNGLLDRLNESLEREKRFTGEASHQLRTPLTALIGSIDVARRRSRTVDEYREVLDDIHEDAVHLRRIVEALLFLSRADAEAMRPDLQRIDLGAWLEAHINHWRSRERGADIQPPTHPESILWVRAQPVLLAQLLDNLLENAVKYSDPGTPILVRAFREDGLACLAVEDRGHGLGPADLSHVFEPFFRSDRARRLGQPGIGLGLAIVQRIASAFGGSVDVRSEVGQGSRFTLRLPEAVTPRAVASLAPFEAAERP